VKRPFDGRPARTRGVVPAGRAIATALQLRGLSDRVRAETLLTEWTELVGPKIAQRTRPEGIYERTLRIEVATSAWLHELNMLRPQLLTNLVERLGEPRLFDDLKFHLVGRRNGPPVLAPRNRRPIVPQKPLPPPATGAARESIVREVSAVDDEELRELIARVRITHDK
jgi:predicted nucleic acid-binding Zn ribbon protein